MIKNKKARTNKSNGWIKPGESAVSLTNHISSQKPNPNSYVCAVVLSKETGVGGVVGAHTSAACFVIVVVMQV